MPVEGRYILRASILGQAGYDNAYYETLSFPFDEQRYTGIELYYTGLTEATVGVIDALVTRGIPHVLMCYVHHNGQYMPIIRQLT